MTKRLGMFLGLGFCGVVLLLTGLAWDAVVHAHDPSLAGREGIFTLRNPGHVLLGLGIGLVLVSLIGGCETLMACADGRWARPGVRQAFLAVSTALVVTAAAVTSWSSGAAHDHPAGGSGHDANGRLAAAVGGSHGHEARGGAGSAATIVDGSPGHDHSADADTVAGNAAPAG